MMGSRACGGFWVTADLASSMSVIQSLSAGLYLLGQESLSFSFTYFCTPSALDLNKPTIQIQHKRSKKIYAYGLCLWT